MRGQAGVGDELNSNELDMQLEAEAVSGIAPYTPRLLQLLQVNQAPAQEVSTFHHISLLHIYSPWGHIGRNTVHYI
jgi:hypothetical protein